MFTMNGPYHKIEKNRKFLSDSVVSPWNRMHPKNLCSMVHTAIEEHNKAEFTKYFVSDDGATIAACWSLYDHGLELPFDATLQIAFQTGDAHHRTPKFFIGIQTEAGESIILRQYTVPPLRMPAIKSIVRLAIQDLWSIKDHIPLNIDAIQRRTLSIEQLAMSLLIGIGKSTIPQNRLRVLARTFWTQKEMTVWEVLTLYSRIIQDYKTLKQMPAMHDFAETVKAAVKLSLKNKASSL
jgi:hypothetical protein